MDATLDARMYIGQAALLLLAVPLIEAFDSSCGVHHLLGSGEEGVASGANLHLHALGGRLGLEYVATRAANLSQLVAGMNSIFHRLGPPGIS